jgi:hypothetical protein
MDISTIDTSVARARQLRDEPQSGRYPTRGYQQRQPSLERGAADQTDLKNERARRRAGSERNSHSVRPGELCPLDREQPYQRLAAHLRHARVIEQPRARGARASGPRCRQVQRHVRRPLEPTRLGDRVARLRGIARITTDVRAPVARCRPIAGDARRCETRSTVTRRRHRAPRITRRQCHASSPAPAAATRIARTPRI